MIEFQEDSVNQICVCTSDKLVTDIVIQKAVGGFIFFEIVFKNGNTPRELSGKYSSLHEGKRAVSKYVNAMKETPAARRENFAKAREERKLKNAAKDQSEGS